MARGSRTSRFLFLAIMTLLAVGAAGYWLLSTSDDNAAPGPVVNRGPSYTEAVVGTWRQINPLLAESEVDRDLVELVFRGLVSLGPDGSVQPELAGVPEVGSDGRTLTFRLAGGLRWSDGHPLDSRDVAFTIRLLQAPDFRGDQTLAQAWLGVKVDTPDEQTVVVTLPYQYAPFAARFATFGILPRHVLESGPGQGGGKDDFNTNPIGAGLYMIASLGTSEARLVANPYFAGAPPQITDLRLRYFRDESAALRALSAGDVDGFLTRGAAGSPPAGTADLPQMQRIAVQRSLALVLYLNNDNAILEGPSVRRALALIVDRSSLPWGDGQAEATVSSSPVAPGSWAYQAGLDLTSTDRKEAMRLLAEAGWVPHATSGVLTNEGSEFRLTLRTDDNPMHVAVATALSRQFESVGIRATVASTTLSVLARDFLQDRKYDAALVTWDAGPDPDPYDAWHSSQLGSAGQNLANFVDPVLDELIAYGRTRTEPAVRLDAYRQIQSRWTEETPSIVLGYPKLTYFVREGITVTLPSVLFKLSQRLSEIEQWQR